MRLAVLWMYEKSNGFSRLWAERWSRGLAMCSSCGRDPGI
jgi:hypothetical protein